jgi:hypothetical protein
MEACLKATMRRRVPVTHARKRNAQEIGGELLQEKWRAMASMGVQRILGAGIGSKQMSSIGWV